MRFIIIEKRLTFISKFNPKTLPFKNLPESYQLALVWYMAVDGEAWDLLGNLESAKDQKEMRKLLQSTLPEYRKKYGNKNFGMVNIPTQIIKQEVMKANEIGKYKSFNNYSKSYQNKMTIPIYKLKGQWPCILADKEYFEMSGEILQDGWHRLQVFINNGAKTIPCTFFL